MSDCASHEALALHDGTQTEHLVEWKSWEQKVDTPRKIGKYQQKNQNNEFFSWDFRNFVNLLIVFLFLLSPS
jgi:hypothetical protein